VDGIPYSWDVKGNLLDDGTRAYTYDHANRLTAVVMGPDAYAYAYNGLGDRLQQTVNGAPENYTLDLVAGLTQLLEDGTKSYLYGVELIEEENIKGRSYLLSDAIGTVRQLAAENHTLSLTKSYAPFGELYKSSGRFNTNYGFTGELHDNTGLVFLRTRYYEPTWGIFLSKDISGGIGLTPFSQHSWAYAQANPIRYSDPSGMCIDQDIDGVCDYWPNDEARIIKALQNPPASDPEGLNPSNRPENITWSPSLPVLPTELRDATGNVVPLGDFQAQYKITSPEGTPDFGERITGACGIFVVAAIVGLNVNDVWNSAYNVDWYWEDTETGLLWPVDVLPNYTSKYELEAVIESYYGWHAYTIQGIDSKQAKDLLSGLLSSNRYVIPGVAISGYSGKLGHGLAAHWVVVSGLSAEWHLGHRWQWIRIYNPFNHQEEYYMWDYFLDNWGRGAEWSGSDELGARSRLAVVAYKQIRHNLPIY